MTCKQFCAKILYTPCEDCPIDIYCKLKPYLSCTLTAVDYYRKHSSGKVEFKWPETDSFKTE